MGPVPVTIRARYAKLKAKGVRIVAEAHEVHPGARAASFADEDGNVIGLYEGPKS